MFGALTLYLHTPRTFDRHELRIALISVELATEVLVDRSSGAPPGQLDPRDHDALATHGHIYQAQGMVMVDLGVTLPQALALMRAHAYAAGQDLASLATDIVARRSRLPQDRPRDGDIENEARDKDGPP